MTAQNPLRLRIYSWCFEQLTPVWRWWLQRRLAKGKETPTSVAQKWMQQASQARPDGTLIWGHAVGVGEAMALVGLMRRLQELRPSLHFLITTTARTSGLALQEQNLGPAFTHWFAPVDTPSTVRRFLDHWKPDLALWCEMDLWPNLIQETTLRNIPHVLVNVRLDAPSFQQRRKAKWLYAPLLQGFNLIWAQNDSTAKLLASLGAHPVRVLVQHNIKAIAPPLKVDSQNLQQWETHTRGRKIWVLASSHEGEEALAIQAQQLLLARHPAALLIIAPRYIERCAAILKDCPPNTPARSQGHLYPNSGAIYIADTLGELGLWYRLASVVMLGGSWVNIGGHNPYEAIALGKKVIHGPSLHNFSESYEDLDRQGAALLALTAEDIAALVDKTWSQPATERQQDGLLPQEAASRLASLLALLP